MADWRAIAVTSDRDAPSTAARKRELRDRRLRAGQTLRAAASRVRRLSVLALRGDAVISAGDCGEGNVIGLGPERGPDAQRGHARPTTGKVPQAGVARFSGSAEKAEARSARQDWPDSIGRAWRPDTSAALTPFPALAQ